MKTLQKKKKKASNSKSYIKTNWKLTKNYKTHFGKQQQQQQQYGYFKRQTGTIAHE